MGPIIVARKVVEMFIPDKNQNNFGLINLSHVFSCTGFCVLVELKRGRIVLSSAASKERKFLLLICKLCCYNKKRLCLGWKTDGS